MALLNSGASEAERALSPSEGSAYDNSTSGKSSGLHFGSLKNFVEKKMTRDGQPQKKRGPKPDAKPAATRRQQLNRQAQRSHRERKELHMHDLELQVIRDKQIHLKTVEEKKAIEEENRLLRQILDQHGICYPTKNQQHGSVHSHPGPSGSIEKSGHNFNFSQSPSTTLSGVTLSSMPEASSFQPDLDLDALNLRDGLDYNEIELNFVLKLEGCCHGHLTGVCVPGQYNSNAGVSGHTLMASYGDVEDRNILRENLKNLLTLSLKLPLEGEITPIMAWVIIATHERFQELTLADFETLGDDLKRVTRCYGFGAALEDFEVRDALSNVFATKFETYATFT
ncbi:hypothetical protein MMC07_002521 [Pseudocyphellaria aurata]|nr:hypothetical protein [Pseudocyphellaria aurata]